jgi:hypothetical protein
MVSVLFKWQKLWDWIHWVFGTVILLSFKGIVKLDVILDVFKLLYIYMYLNQL